MHIHLEPLGGIAGDMFVASVLDAFPHLEAELRAAFITAGLDKICRIERHPHCDKGLTGSRFEVRSAHPPREDDSCAKHPHRHYADIVALINDAPLPSGVQARALDIFTLLAKVEARIHGVDIKAVGFHEIGAWDSIADICAAAFCIEQLDATWSSAPLPIGHGQIMTAHGKLPVPAPATARLLEGFPVFQDGIAGERITPTGAAIVRHLDPSFTPLRSSRRLQASGYGFGTKTWDQLANTLRILVFSEDCRPKVDSVGVCEFEIDDQTPEDLAIALEHLRQREEVLDINQSMLMGKKGRLTIHVRALVHPQAIDAFSQACLHETTTLGVRWQVVNRHIVDRATATVNHATKSYRIKQAWRPGNVSTVKLEADDLMNTSGGHAQRQSLRHLIESRARVEGREDRGENNDL